jgi:hypothetical protein
MKAASLKDIQTELEELPKQELMKLCLRLARFKKENKELLTYLLFEAFDEAAYISIIQKDVEEQFAAINSSNVYFVKKSLRKILRMITKFSRYTGSSVVEAQLLLHFCTRLKATGVMVHASPALENIWQNQVKKIRKVIATMHEDLQFDYLRELEPLIRG